VLSSSSGGVSARIFFITLASEPLQYRRMVPSGERAITLMHPLQGSGKGVGRWEGV
jgi:hypothetical protein